MELFKNILIILLANLLSSDVDFTRFDIGNHHFIEIVAKWKYQGKASVKNLPIFL